MPFKASQPLVSIIVPCYNCGRWVGQTVESCLNQTYPNIEIVVIDDGSTDQSYEIIRQFLPRIRLESGSNRGGNSARNRGLALSTGEYIQYLDADDYLEPDTIARQARVLSENETIDAVYGDWRFKIHLPDSNISYLDKVISGQIGQDILASALAGHYPPTAAVLYRRRIVTRVSGWDEALGSAQDRDFFTSVVMSGAIMSYQPGCCYVYRKYDAVTVSSSNLARWVEGNCISLRKSEMELARTSRLDEYKDALVMGYFELARAVPYYTVPALPTYLAYTKILDVIIQKIQKLAPDFAAANETRIFRAIQRMIGLECAMRLLWVRMVLRRLKVKIRKTLTTVLPFSVTLRMRGIRFEREDTHRSDVERELGIGRVA